MGVSSLLDRLSESLLFDRKDYELLTIVGDVLKREDLSGLKHLLAPYLHPRGVKELAANQALRIAYAAAHLLGSLEIGKAHDRLNALSGLRDEAMNASVTYLRRNTARVLMQIMKELVRTQGDRRRQLELAHDFRMAATGKPRIIARQLKLYRLLLMPEDWTQICFDNHVHDANTTGRKSATHLIMDAWIKGIRHLTVIYYHFVLPSVAEELLQAARIMGVKVRIGIEFITRAMDKPVKIIWVPRGFTGPSEYLSFLRMPAVERFLKQGQSLMKLQEEQLLHVLVKFNSDVLPSFNASFGVDAPEIPEAGFQDFVGTGQASLLHLGKYIHSRLLPSMRTRFEELQASYFAANAEEKARIEHLADELNNLDAEAFVDDFLEQLVSPEAPEAARAHGSPGQPGLPDPLNPEAPAGPSRVPEAHGPPGTDAPDVEHCSYGPGPTPKPAGQSVVQALYCPNQTPAQLIDAVAELRVGSRFILNLWGLDADEVLEILHDCNGRITHLEVVNLRNADLGDPAAGARVAELQEMINARSVIPLKRWVMSRIAELSAQPSSQAPLPETGRLERMVRLLEAVPGVHARYRDRPLRTSIGSDSTGQSCRGHGMGMAVLETLPPSVARSARGLSHDPRGAMVVGLGVQPMLIFEPRESTHPTLDALYAMARRHPWLRGVGYTTRREFGRMGFHPAKPGRSNILILGGVHAGCGNQFVLKERPTPKRRRLPDWFYCNNTMKNVLKVAAGFIPAFLTFFLTKDWWVQAYLGAFIWFGITGVRNIIQSVLGGGGLRRTPLLRWNDYVSWSRLCESLLYTGFSVPLLDYVAKTLILDRGLHVSVATNAAALYAIMALVNGSYICAHNLLRGLPRQAAFWNLFRSVLSIPLAMALSAGLGLVLAPGDPSGADQMLQQWAAVISKLASDCVAGIIEGLADRGYNMRQRLRDYREKIAQMLSVQEKLEILFPSSDVPAMLGDPRQFVDVLVRKRSDLAHAVIVNSLDFLYFWMYQPRARSALALLFREMDAQTRQTFLLSQRVLQSQREISQLFLDGLLGKNFSRGLAFYLEYAEGYLRALEILAKRTRL